MARCRPRRGAGSRSPKGSCPRPTIGSDFADTYNGGTPPNGDIVIAGVDDIFEGGAGNDTIIGDGNTTVLYDDATAGVVIDLAAGTATGNASVGTDVLSGVANVVGSDFADVITGDAGNNIIDGSGGADTLDGGAGVDELFFLDDIGGSTFGVIIDLGAGTVTNDGTGSADVIANFENVQGSLNADQITGSAVANRLEGHAGNDTISGGAGDDRLIGGEGADSMDGGIGFDTYQYDKISDGTQITTNQTVQASGLATDVIPFNTVDDGFAFDETAFGVVASVPLVALGVAYDGTNSGLASGAAFIIDNTGSTSFLSFDPDVNTPGYTVIAETQFTVLPSDINPL